MKDEYVFDDEPHVPQSRPLRPLRKHDRRADLERELAHVLLDIGRQQRALLAGLNAMRAKPRG